MKRFNQYGMAISISMLIILIGIVISEIYNHSPNSISTLRQIAISVNLFSFLLNYFSLRRQKKKKIKEDLINSFPE